MCMVKSRNFLIIHAVIVGLFTSYFISYAEASDFPVSNAIFKTSSFSDYDSIIFDLVNQTSRGNIEGVLHQLENVAERLKRSDDAITDGSVFLQRFINSMNDLYGTSVTSPQILQLTREFVRWLPIPDDEIGNYFLGLDLIDNQPFGFVYHETPCPLTLVRHHKRSNVWTWLSIATVTAGAVVVCVFCPEAAIPVIEGAVEIGKLIISDQK